MGHDQMALAQKTVGVSVVKLTDPRWTSVYKTAQRISTIPTTGAPTFSAQAYGSNRGALLRDIAKAWSGTLYKAGGTTFDGIDNDEFVREVYGAVNETDLDGTPKQWSTMGKSVPRDQLEPGDIIRYQATGFGGVFNQRHAGIYIGDGQFVHAVSGAAVTISKIDDPRWSNVFKDARRIDPEQLTRAEAKADTTSRPTTQRPASRPTVAKASPRPTTQPAAHGAPATPAAPPPSATAVPSNSASATPSSSTAATDAEREAQLREAIQPRLGTPYRIGGTTKAGIDCSAFARAVYQSAYGFELPRTAEEQEHLGTSVSRDDLVVGDLVFFRTQGMGPLFKSRHVGVYVGNGQFAQASGSKGVCISSLDDYYWSRKYSAARRIPAATAHH